MLLVWGLVVLGFILESKKGTSFRKSSPQSHSFYYHTESLSQSLYILYKLYSRYKLNQNYFNYYKLVYFLVYFLEKQNRNQEDSTLQKIWNCDLWISFNGCCSIFPVYENRRPIMKYPWSIKLNSIFEIVYAQIPRAAGRG